MCDPLPPDSMLKKMLRLCAGGQFFSKHIDEQIQHFRSFLKGFVSCQIKRKPTLIRAEGAVKYAILHLGN